MSDKSVKLKPSTPDSSGGEEVGRGGVLEEKAWDRGNNYTGVEIVQQDSEVSAEGEIENILNSGSENFKRNRKLSSMGGGIPRMKRVSRSRNTVWT